MEIPENLIWTPGDVLPKVSGRYLIVYRSDVMGSYYLYRLVSYTIEKQKDSLEESIPRFKFYDSDPDYGYYVIADPNVPGKVLTWALLPNLVQ